MKGLQYHERQGFWKKAEALLGVDSDTLRNYYHNTWRLRFFDPLTKELQTEFLGFVDKCLKSELTVEASVQLFLANHPRLHLNERQLRQQAGVRKLRLKPSRCGFSVSISDCCVLNDALGL